MLVASLGALAVATLILVPRFAPRPTEEPVRQLAAVRHADAANPPAPPGEPSEVRTMVASYYASSLAGNPTAGGGTYRPERLTAAHKTLPLGTELRISYGNESVKVVVNDRGPYVPGHDLDLSLAAARDIGLVEPGVAPVRVTVL